MEESKTSDRKKDHIELAMQSHIGQSDPRFYYEPILNGHPNSKTYQGIKIAKKETTSPIWVSSMTGGTKMAGTINKNLAKACKEFGMGMGLGSCRILLEEDTYFEDFNLRPILGDDIPFFANLGIAQIEYLLRDNKVHLISELIDKLQADGLFVHINPLQEYLQPEGDLISQPPLETIKRLLDEVSFPICVKEVGQGMGPASLLELMQLPIEAIEFGALGGTNFSKLELLRDEDNIQEAYGGLSYVGHSAAEMVDFINTILNKYTNLKCTKFLVSGGIKTFLDGYYLTNRLNSEAGYAMASQFLKYAQSNYDTLREFTLLQHNGLSLANNLLKIKHE